MFLKKAPKSPIYLTDRTKIMRLYRLLPECITWLYAPLARDAVGGENGPPHPFLGT